MPATVTLTVNSGRYYAILPEALAQRGLLRQAVRQTSVLEILEPDATGTLKSAHQFPSQQTGNKILWNLWRRLPHPWRNILPLTPWAWLADYRVARRLQSCGIFHGVMGVNMQSLRWAKRVGATTIIDTPTLHPEACRQAAIKDLEAAGAPQPHIRDSVLPRSVVRRCEWQYSLCDRILVKSIAAQRTFEGYAYARKTFVLHSGVDHNVFKPPETPADRSRFRVGYVGRIEAAKGVHYLLEAWKAFGLTDGELVLAGYVLPEMAVMLGDASIHNVTLTGVLQIDGVIKLLQECDLFVFPSVNEGLAVAVLEAMSCGVPVVACRGTGADDCLEDGCEGLLVPGRNSEALKEAMGWCYAHRYRLREMGRAARERVANEFTLDCYVGRVLAFYSALVCNDHPQENNPD